MLLRRLTHRDFVYVFSDLLSLTCSCMIQAPSLFMNWSGKRIWTRRFIARVNDVTFNPNRTIHKGIGVIAGITTTGTTVTRAYTITLLETE